MAQTISDSPSRARCSYKTATALVCTCNVLAALYVLQLLLSPLYFFSPATPALGMVRQNLHFPLKAVRYTEEQLRRINEAVEVWKAAEPVDLIKRVKEIQLESVAGALKYDRIAAMKEKLTSDLLERLKELRAAGNESHQQQQALEEWRKKKLEEIKMQEERKKDDEDTSKAKRDAQAAVLEDGWSSLLEEIGADPPTEQAQEMPSDFESEDGIIPGRELPPECHGEPHTDYTGLAVRWGLTFHVESAADCCQACLDQARAAKPDQLKCNIWVYCPQEGGCYSPDKYEHKHQECWLKQDAQPKLNFKGKYDPEYRKGHPTAPVVVPWVSGVISP